VTDDRTGVHRPATWRPHDRTDPALPSSRVSTAPALQRFLELDGVFNFRDLGGYRTADGRSVRWRTLFRADALGRLTPDDVEAIRPLGLRTVVDLRTQRELDERGRFPVDSHPVTFHHLAVIDETWDQEAARRENLPAHEFLHRAYSAMLVEGGARFASAFELLAAPGALPAVFHCAAGKDRTGLLAMLVLGSLGVRRDEIVDDYALTQASMARFLDTMRTDPERAALIDAAPPAFFAADPQAIGMVVDDLEREHGSVREYARSIGVADEVLARLDAALLDAA
jgi:protein-tyrosine phosphatase